MPVQLRCTDCTKRTNWQFSSLWFISVHLRRFVRALIEVVMRRIIYSLLYCAAVTCQCSAGICSVRPGQWRRRSIHVTTRTTSATRGQSPLTLAPGSWPRSRRWTSRDRGGATASTTTSRYNASCPTSFISQRVDQSINQSIGRPTRCGTWGRDSAPPHFC